MCVSTVCLALFWKLNSCLSINYLQVLLCCALYFSKFLILLFTFSLKVVYLIYLWKSQGKKFLSTVLQGIKSCLWWWVMLTLGSEQDEVQSLLSLLCFIPWVPAWLITYSEWIPDQKKISGQFNVLCLWYCNSSWGLIPKIKKILFPGHWNLKFWNS